MQYTIDNALGVSAGAACGQYPFKDSYGELQIGGDSKLKQFYIDLSTAIESRPNSEHEGGVRPPG